MGLGLVINDSGKMETAYGKERPRLLCWMKESNAHGLVYTPHFFPEGERPELGEWIRAPWLDEKGPFERFIGRM